jgi:(p)ppGpp synthase/HD superfamily hydrolase
MKQSKTPDASAQRYGRALAYAAEKHAGQKRKGTRIPYISHPLAVASLVLEYGGSEDEVIAALLHDVPEDCGGQEVLDEIRQKFGMGAAAIVEGCSDTLESPKPKWRPRKEAHIANLHTAHGSVRLVAAADKLHNALSILRDYRKRGVGEKVWERFAAPKEEVLWYYGAVAHALRAKGSNPLVEELDRAVGELLRAGGGRA